MRLTPRVKLQATWWGFVGHDWHSNWVNPRYNLNKGISRVPGKGLYGVRSALQPPKPTRWMVLLPITPNPVGASLHQPACWGTRKTDHSQRPINSTNNPIPTPTATTSDRGTIHANHCRGPHRDRMKKIILHIPERDQPGQFPYQTDPPFQEHGTHGFSVRH